MTAAALPNFCAWMNGRFGRGWIVTRRGGEPGTGATDEFRRAKRAYEDMIGCRIYSPEYLAMFHDAPSGREVQS